MRQDVSRAKQPGDYPITASGASASNYTITYANSVLYVLLPPLLTDTAEEGGQFMFRWETVARQRYQLESTADLYGDVWTPVGDLLTGTGDPISVTNAQGCSTSREKPFQRFPSRWSRLTPN